MKHLIVRQLRRSMQNNGMQNNGICFNLCKGKFKYVDKNTKSYFSLNDSDERTLNVSLDVNYDPQL